MKFVLKILFSLIVISYSLVAEEFTVSKITDGDTIHVIDQYEKDIVIRFNYIDTMESYKNKRAKTIARKCNIPIKELVTSGKEAKEHLNTLIPVGTKVTIVFHGMDNLNKRSMGEVFLNDVSINQEMVQSGHAIPYYEYITDVEIFKRYTLAYATSDSIEDPILSNECIKNYLKQ